MCWKFGSRRPLLSQGAYVVWVRTGMVANRLSVVCCLTEVRSKDREEASSTAKQLVCMVTLQLSSVTIPEGNMTRSLWMCCNVPGAGEQ